MKLLLTGVDGNLGGYAADILLTLEPKENLVYCGYNPESLVKYADQGVETHVTNFNNPEGLIEAVKKIIYTSLVNADDETNPSVEKKDHIYTERYIADQGLDYIFLRNSQYAEAMITNYFTYVKMGGPLMNSQGDGLMAYISRKDCAKAVAYALHRAFEPQYDHAVLNINGPQLMTISKFCQIGNEETGNNVSYKFVTDEENYQIFDAMGVPRTTDGVFKEGSEAPFSSDGMVTFAQAIREGKMDIWTRDFERLTGDKPITVREMFANNAEYQIGDRHSKDD